MISQNACKYDFQQQIEQRGNDQYGLLKAGIQTVFYVKILTFEMQHSSKIRDAKFKTYSKTKFYTAKSNLYYQAEISYDDKTIDNYQICNKTVINDVARDGIQIFAKTLNGKTFPIEIRKSNKLIDIKKKIEEKLGLCTVEQKIIFHGKILDDDDDDKSIDEYQICDKSVINIISRLRGGMQLFAKTINGTAVPFEVQKSEKIMDIKMKIHEKMGFCPEEQKLVYMGDVLDNDDKTIDEYQICDQSVISVVAALRGAIQIFAKTLDGKSVSLEVQKSDRIIDIKIKIQEKTGLHPDKQVLVYQGETLVNEKTINEYQIIDKSVINFVVRRRNKIQIFANIRDGKSISLKVDKSYKIIDVKLKIEKLIELNPDNQILIYNGILLEDGKTIDEYRICNKSVINIIDNYHIFILAKPVEGVNNAIFVHKSFKIIDIKKKIQDKLGLHPNEQNYFYRGIILDDDDKRLIEYGIDKKSAIDIIVEIINGMQLFVKTIDGSRVIIYVKKSDKIRNVKLKIQEKLGLPQNEQKLSYCGRILNDDKTIGEYQLCDQSTIDIDSQIKLINSIFERLQRKSVNFGMKLFAKIMEGEIISIYIGQKDKIKYIKWQIHFQTGLHPDVQKLVYNGVVLEDEKLVKDYQISTLSTLELEKMIEVFAKISRNKIYSIYLLKTDKIEDVKCRIHEKSGLHRDEQVLFFQNKLLSNDDKTVNQYGITETSIIDLFVPLKNEIQIFVQTSNQSIIPINILKTAKIADLKSNITEKTGIKFEGNNLVYKTIVLENENLLSKYMIDDGSVISIDYSQIVLFIQAIKSGSLEKVRNLYVNKFQEVIKQQFSPMHYACKQQNADIVKFLIENKFEINIYDQKHNLPIHYACINGFVEILELLVQNKCKIEACDSHGMKPIHLACLNGNFQNVKLLIENHCDLESKDSLKRRPIHLACLAGNIDIVKLLIENNCKINIVDQSNKSPFNFAEKENRLDIIEIMDEGISTRMIENMIKELELKCNDNCDHKFCQTSLRKKTFIKGNEIGRGGAGKVYKSTLSQSSRQIAIKKILKDKIDSKSIEGNINRFIKKINHERIIKYFGAMTKEKFTFIFMEYMSEGSLRTRISTNPPIISSRVIQYTMQILEGLKFLHSNKIIHRDIKPDNVLLDNSGNVKLTDLGLGLSLCTTDGRTTKADSFCGTTYYMAPEIINGEKYSYGADIWALGITVLEMATGKRPYHDLQAPQAVIFKIATTKTVTYQLPTFSPNKMQLFLNRILIQEPSQRPTATNLIEILKTIKCY